MGRLFLLTAVVAVAAISAVPAIAVETNVSCTQAEKQLGLCSRVEGDSVELEGWQSGDESAAVVDNPHRPVGPVGDGIEYVSVSACLINTRNDPGCFPSTPSHAVPTVTVRDIASFVPTAGRQLMEPNGWAVVGLDTNFYAVTEPHVVPGTLLGRPADVRFTPTGFRWSYGDGTSATKSTKGATWASQGIREFEPTPTSHVYKQLGDYTITLSITFSAEYRFDGSVWRPVVGAITLPANDLHIRAGNAKTVLVEDDCLANPSGPGC